MTAPTLTLNNGLQMPSLGMGTYPLTGLPLALLVRQAAAIGYRLFDTSAAYGNESWLGWGLKFCGVPRGELFVTTKLSNSEQRDGDVRVALRNSLRRLKLNYLDLYLMHWPNPETFVDCWKQMEDIYREGKLVRAIGVCNFHRHHLEALLEAGTVVPAVNQVEIHPLLSQAPLREFCANHAITMEAYSPVARMDQRLIAHPTLLELAAQKRKTIPQIILRWDVQHRLIPIPKASSKARLQENFDIFSFELSAAEMAAIDAVNQDIRVRFDPDNCDFSKL